MESGKTYPRVLIFGQGFNTNSGGGITLINLFNGWPKEKLASVVKSKKYVFHNNVCNNIYFLKRWVFPFSLFERAGNVHIDYIAPVIDKNEHMVTSSHYLKFVKLLNSFYKFLDFLGLLPYFHKKKLSKDFIKWARAFNPDIIYSQLADVSISIMVYKLSSILDRPIAIHIMDDWPMTIYKKGFLSYFNRIRMESYFKAIIKKSNVHLAISESMCLEYKKRYNEEFIAFHNPVDLSIWSSYQKNTWDINEKILILYLGRVGIATIDGIFDLTEVVSELNSIGYNIQLEIITPDFNENLKQQIEIDPNINLLPKISNEIVPTKLSKADILFLPLDFDDNTLKFVRYSIPTKATEYMAIGVPILIYAPNSIALTDYANKDNWGFVVNKKDISLLKNGIIEMVENHNLRKKLGQKSLFLVRQKHDSLIVREEFREVLYKSSCK